MPSAAWLRSTPASLKPSSFLNISCTIRVNWALECKPESDSSLNRNREPFKKLLAIMEIFDQFHPYDGKEPLSDPWLAKHPNLLQLCGRLLCRGHTLLQASLDGYQVLMQWTLDQARATAATTWQGVEIASSPPSFPLQPKSNPEISQKKPWHHWICQRSQFYMFPHSIPVSTRTSRSFLMDIWSPVSQSGRMRLFKSAWCWP